MNPTDAAPMRTKEASSSRTTLTPVMRSRSSREPTMMIYAAILGQSPRIDPTLSAEQSRLELSLHVDYSLKTMPAGLPGLRPTLRERVEHWAALAADKLQQAKQRVDASRQRADASRQRAEPSRPRGEPSQSLTESSARAAPSPRPSASIHLVGPTRRATADAA